MITPGALCYTTYVRDQPDGKAPMNLLALSAVYDVTPDGLSFHVHLSVNAALDGTYTLDLRDNTRHETWEFPAKRHALREYIRIVELAAGDPGAVIDDRLYTWDYTDVVDVPYNRYDIYPDYAYRRNLETLCA